MATPLAQFNFDEPSGDVIDTTGNGHDITLASSGQRSTTAKNGTGAATGGLDLAGGPSGNTVAAFSPLSRSATFWARRTGSGVWALRWQINSLDTGAFGVYCLPDLRARARRGGTSYNAVATGVTPGAGWQHYGVVFNATTSALAFYLDGTLRATTTVGGSGALDTADLVDIDGDVGGWTVDDVRLYGVALTLAEVQADMASAVPPLPSGSPTVLWWDGLIEHEAAVTYWNGTSESPVGSVWTGATEVEL